MQHPVTSLKCGGVVGEGRDGCRMLLCTPSAIGGGAKLVGRGGSKLDHVHARCLCCCQQPMEGADVIRGVDSRREGEGVDVENSGCRGEPWLLAWRGTLMQLDDCVFPLSPPPLQACASQSSAPPRPFLSIRGPQRLFSPKSGTHPVQGGYPPSQCPAHGA